MNIMNERYEYIPDLFGNLSLPEADRVVWVLMPPTLAAVQGQDTEEKRRGFYRELLDRHVVEIRNMKIGGETVRDVRHMESLAARHLSPRQARRIADELLKAVTEACFLGPDETKN